MSDPKVIFHNHQPFLPEKPKSVSPNIIFPDIVLSDNSIMRMRWCEKPGQHIIESINITEIQDNFQDK